MVISEDIKEKYAPLSETKNKSTYHVIKRVFDIVLSLAACIVFLLPMCTIALAIMVVDKGNPFFVQTRVGLNGEEFRIVKLRSMKKGAECIMESLNREQLTKYRSEYKLDDDPRLLGWKKPGDGTRCFGARLRRSSMDELPQIFFNILLTGHMSVVGPRPVLKDELYEHYTPDEREILLSVKPGLTGYWQATARNNASYSTGLRQEMELDYAQNENFLWDVRIVFQTFGAILKKQGAK